MDTFYINRKLTDDRMFEEVVSFFTLYLFAEQISISSNICYYVNLWQSRNNWSDDEIIELSYLFDPNFENTYPRKELYEHFAYYKTLKNKNTHKNKKLLGFMNRFRALMNSCKTVITCMLEDFMTKSSLWPWLDLFDNSTIKLLHFAPCPGTLDDDVDKYFPIIEPVFLENKNFQLLNFYFEVEKPIPIEKENNTIINSTEYYYYSTSLFYFPFCFHMELGKLKAVRLSMQSKINKISSMLLQFKEAVTNIDFNDDIEEKCNLLNEQLLPETQIMQQHIDKEPYLLQMLNKSDVNIFITLNIGVAPLALIFDYYKNASVFSQPFIDSFLNKFSNTINQNKTCVFLYWTFDDKKPE